MKKFIIMALMAVFGLTTVSAQKTVVAKKNQKVFDIVEQMPEYPGGQAALFEFISKNVKYPEDAVKKKVEGKVFVTFVVDTDGKITDVSLMRKVFPSLDAEAIRVISAMPNWIPGKQKGQVVRVKYTVPIMFRLK
jgi:protein TonB